MQGNLKKHFLAFQLMHDVQIDEQSTINESIGKPITLLLNLDEIRQRYTVIKMSARGSKSSEGNNVRLSHNGSISA